MNTKTIVSLGLAVLLVFALVAVARPADANCRGLVSSAQYFLGVPAGWIGVFHGMPGYTGAVGQEKGSPGLYHKAQWRQFCFIY